MTPIQIRIEDTKLIVLPETKVEADGHPILTYNYHIFKNDEDEDMVGHQPLAQTTFYDKSIENPYYYGYVTFVYPDKLFSYTSNDERKLSSDMVEGLIEKITYYRDHPNLWKFD